MCVGVLKPSRFFIGLDSAVNQKDFSIFHSLLHNRIRAASILTLLISKPSLNPKLLNITNCND